MMRCALLARLGQRSPRAASLALAGLLWAFAEVGGCSNFVGPGPDPAADGRVDGGAGLGGAGSCNPLAAIDPSSTGRGCTQLLGCLQSHCDPSLRACFGNDYPNQRFAGGLCEGVVSCVANNGCNPNNSGSCVDQAQPGCKTCLMALANCESNNCQGSCSSGSGGGAGMGGSGGSSSSTVLAANVQVNAIALDTTTVYFSDQVASQSGIAKVNKDGSGEQGLGTFPQASGLALDASGLYFVNSMNNSLVSLQKDGTGQLPLATWMCGGGMGSLVLDAPSIYVSSGSNLFAVPVAGGSPATLANDVAPFNGGPAPGPRVATDGQNVYYAAGNMMGGGQRISGVLKSATSPGSNCGTIAGTQIALAYGNVMALTLNQGVLTFTDLTSDGVTPKLVVRAILLPAALGSATAVDVATLRPPTSGPSTPNPGTALVADPGSGDLYLSGFDGIYRMTCTAAGCSAPGLFVSGAVASALAVDDSYLYYGDQNSGPNGASGLKKIAK